MQTPISAVKCGIAKDILEPPERKYSTYININKQIYIYRQTRLHIPSVGWCFLFIIVELNVWSICICMIIEGIVKQILINISRRKEQRPKVKRLDNLPEFTSSRFAESSHIKETDEMEIGICRGFFNSMSTFIASANRWRRIYQKDPSM